MTAKSHVFAIANANPSATRQEILKLCVAEGLKATTASTMYACWKRENSGKVNNTFESLCKDSNKYGERNDCTVKALALTCQIPYEQSHEVFRKLGRRKGRGFRTMLAFPSFRKLGFQFEKITNQYGGDTPLQPGTAYRYTPKTIGKLCKKGRYLAFCRGHVFAVIDGKVMDWTEGRKHKIIKLFKVEG